MPSKTAKFPNKIQIAVQKSWSNCISSFKPTPYNLIFLPEQVGKLVEDLTLALEQSINRANTSLQQQKEPVNNIELRVVVAVVNADENVDVVVL